MRWRNEIQENQNRVFRFLRHADAVAVGAVGAELLEMGSAPITPAKFPSFERLVAAGTNHFPEW